MKKLLLLSRNIFALCMDGMGPTQIANRRKELCILGAILQYCVNICNEKYLAKNYIVSDDLVRIRVKDANLRAYLLAYFTSATALSHVIRRIWISTTAFTARGIFRKCLFLFLMIGVWRKI